MQQKYTEQVAYQQSLIARIMQGDKAAEQEYLSIINENVDKMDQIK